MYLPTTWQISSFWDIQTGWQLAPPGDLAGYRAPLPSGIRPQASALLAGKQGERVWGTPEHRVGKFNEPHQR